MNPYLQDADLTLYQGDALEVLRGLPDESVHMCVTSPPFYGLRDYGTGRWEGGNPDCDHRRDPDGGDRHGRYLAAYVRPETGKATGGAQKKRTEAGEVFHDVCGKCGASRVDQQIGLEASPEEWCAKLVAVFREVRRVLRADGTCWVEVGDSYASTAPGTIVDPGAMTGKHVNEGAYRRQRTPNGVKPKDLIGAPWMLAFALRADGWYLRSDIVWSRPNPMPESVKDRPTKSHSYVFLLSKSARYFFDQEAVREPHTPDGRLKTVHDHLTEGSHPNYDNIGNGNERWPNSGRNVRSVWSIPTQAYSEAHFATFPEELVRRCILAGSSERGCCPECGAPWEREVEQTPISPPTYVDKGGPLTHGRGGQVQRFGDGVTTKTTGWKPSCDHGMTVAPVDGETPVAPAPVPCTVLDPFAGSGTTGLVARKHGRRSILIELSEPYCQLIARRTQQLSLEEEPA